MTFIRMICPGFVAGFYRGFWPWLAGAGLIGVLLNACLQGGDGDGRDDATSEIETLNRDTLFVGVPLKVWATFRSPVHDSELIRWKAGFGSIVRRSPGNEKLPYDSDTVYIDWKELPPPNTTQVGANNNFIYIDTIQVLVNGVPSNPISIKIENLFPLFDSLVLSDGLTAAPGEDSIHVSVQYGSRVVAVPHFTDLLKPSRVSIDWPGFLKVGGENPELHPMDSTYDLGVAPTVSYDQSGFLTLFDGNGASKRWVLRYRTYQETGSIWVGTPSEIMKFSSDGFQLYRNRLPLSETVLMGINRKLEAVYFVDKSQKRVRKFESRTFREVPDFALSTLQTPHNILIDDEYVWLAQDDIGSSVNSRLEKFSARDGKTLDVVLPGIPGRILSMSANRNRSGELWFINSLEDKIFFVRGDTVSLALDSIIVAPKLVSYDAEEGKVWVTNGAELVTMDENGTVLSRMTGFGSIVAISAGLGKCWVADRFTGKVYMLDHSITQIRTVEELAPNEFTRTYRDPVFVQMVLEDDPACWVADLGNGMVIRVEDDGEERAQFTGIIAPKVVFVN